MSSTDQPAKCRGLYKVISGLSDITTACSVDRKTYMPVAKAAGDEAPQACPR